MANENKTLPALSAITTPQSSDLLYLVRSNVGSKITYGNLVAGIEGMVIGGGGGGTPLASDPRASATNALNEGLVGDGTTDDTAAFAAAVATALADDNNLWNGYHVLYMPTGYYYINNPQFTAISNLYVVGDGMYRSRFRQNTGSRFMNFDDCNYIRFTDLGFDLNGITNFGGLRFAQCNHVWVSQCRFYDSAPLGLATGDIDRFAMITARDGDTSTSVYCGYNLVEDSQLEFDHVQGLIVEHNLNVRSATTVGMGTFGIGDGGIATDLIYRHNRIIGAQRIGLCVQKDSTDGNMEFRRVMIYDNEIIFTISGGTGIRLGTPSTTIAQVTDVFEDIHIIGNKIRYLPGCPNQQDGNGGIVALAPNSGYGYDRCTCSSNILDGNLRGLYQAIELNRWRDGFVWNNTIMRAFGSGIALIRECENMSVKWNMIDTGSNALALTDSGDNNTFSSNYYLDSSTFFQSNTQAGDTLNNPILNTDARKFTASKSWSPGEILDGATASTTVTMTGVSGGDRLVANFSGLTTAGWFVSAVKSATDTVTVTIMNKTGGPVTPTGTLSVTVARFYQGSI